MQTVLDQIANQNHLHLLKVIIPYLPAGRQKTCSVLVKILELQNILRFYHDSPGMPVPPGQKLRAQEYSDSEFSGSEFSDPEPQPPDLLDILTDMRNYCEGPELDMIDQMIQMMGMLELYSVFAAESQQQ